MSLHILLLCLLALPPFVVTIFALDIDMVILSASSSSSPEKEENIIIPKIYSGQSCPSGVE